MVDLNVKSIDSTQLQFRQLTEQTSNYTEMAEGNRQHLRNNTPMAEQWHWLHGACTQPDGKGEQNGRTRLHTPLNSRTFQCNPRCSSTRSEIAIYTEGHQSHLMICLLNRST